VFQKLYNNYDQFKTKKIDEYASVECCLKDDEKDVVKRVQIKKKSFKY
jgi:hypothetical protein